MPRTRDIFEAGPIPELPSDDDSDVCRSRLRKSLDDVASPLLKCDKLILRGANGGGGTAGDGGMVLILSFIPGMEFVMPIISLLLSRSRSLDRSLCLCLCFLAGMSTDPFSMLLTVSEEE